MKINAPKLEFLHVESLSIKEDKVKIFEFLSSIKHSLTSLSTFGFPFHAKHHSDPSLITVLETIPRLRSLAALVHRVPYEEAMQFDQVSTRTTSFSLEELILLVGVRD
ncbi:hypothetical protein FRC17_001000, partial [Serendipita sp. 399]